MRVLGATRLSHHNILRHASRLASCFGCGRGWRKPSNRLRHVVLARVIEITCIYIQIIDYNNYIVADWGINDVGS